MIDINELSNRIVHELISDMRDRGGFSNVWDSIDDGIQKEMISSWVFIVKQNISEDLRKENEGGFDSHDGKTTESNAHS